MSNNTYTALSKFTSQATQLNVLNLDIWDNKLNRNKFDLLGNMVEMSNLKGLILVNHALPFGIDED
jgi:hypothetical protein